MIEWFFSLFKFEPKFKPGDDVQFIRSEHWDATPKAHILEIGKRNYRYRYYHTTTKQLLQTDQTMSFEDMELVYERVERTPNEN